MPRDKKPPALAAPAVASTGCSSLMSRLSLCRAQPPQPRPNDDSKGDELVPASEFEECWRRMQFLEFENRRLARLLGQVEKRTAPADVSLASRGGVVAVAVAESIVRNVAAKANKPVGVVVRNGAKAAGKEERAGAGTDVTTAASAWRCSVGNGASGSVQQGRTTMAKLEDGSYLRDVIRVRLRPWERLAVHLSRPIILDDAPTASEVLDKMTAKTSADYLREFLAQKLPLKDIGGRQINPGEPVRQMVRLSSSGDDIVDALVSNAMDRMEGLLQEGLKIQTASTSSAAGAPDLPTAGHRQRHGENCMVHVVQMQVRDPKQGYAAVGDPMIGLIEATLESTKDGKVMMDVHGMHIAGIGSVNRQSSGDGRRILWSVSLRKCRVQHGGGDGYRCSCVRNPDRVFKQ